MNLYAKIVKESDSPVIDKKPLSKEKYSALMYSLDDIIDDIGSNKEQLLDLRDEIVSEFNRVLGLKESEKLNEGTEDFKRNFSSNLTNYVNKALSFKEETKKEDLEKLEDIISSFKDEIDMIYNDFIEYINSL